MPEIERITFDFSEDGYLESIERLEGILCSNHWSSRTLHYKDERTILLLRLLRIGGIAVYRREYTRKAETPEIRRRAEDFNILMNKQYVGQTLLDIAGIFFKHECDVKKTIFNSLFFPELKSYVRLDGLPPDRLLELLEQEDCEAVMLFPNTCADGEDEFFAFSLAMPKELFLNALGEMRGRISDAIHEALQKTRETDAHIIPPLSVWPSEK